MAVCFSPHTFSFLGQTLSKWKDGFNWLVILPGKYKSKREVKSRIYMEVTDSND